MSCFTSAARYLNHTACTGAKIGTCRRGYLLGDNMYNNGLPAGYDAWRTAAPEYDAPSGSGMATIQAKVQYTEDGDTDTFMKTFRLGVRLEDEGSEDELIQAVNDSGELGEGEVAVGATLDEWEPDGPPDREWDE